MSIVQCIYAHNVYIMRAKVFIRARPDALASVRCASFCWCVCVCMFGVNPGVVPTAEMYIACNARARENARNVRFLITLSTTTTTALLLALRCDTATAEASTSSYRRSPRPLRACPRARACVLACVCACGSKTARHACRHAQIYCALRPRRSTTACTCCYLRVCPRHWNFVVISTEFCIKCMLRERACAEFVTEIRRCGCRCGRCCDCWAMENNAIVCSGYTIDAAAGGGDQRWKRFISPGQVVVFAYRVNLCGALCTN